MVAIYEEKPRRVEAMQFKGTENAGLTIDFIVGDNTGDVRIIWHNSNDYQRGGFIQQPGIQSYRFRVDDWIIKHRDGTFEAVNDNKFQRTYELRVEA